ncbi:membrane protein [Rhizocola hellebori]|uniref:Membrane protein n=1 Tax=Rhizocola hellebori TaxID=1392758 RepID=A0A8J3QCF1_9ACTN|nr:ABC transporter permease [Rhizocola hellebori]GIH08253.1 membrane protein [Rhizocola hellebori]
MSADGAVQNSVIHDIGYQRYDGPRLSRGYAARSLFVHGLRASFGLGRSAKAKIFPWIIIGIVSAIALIVAVVRAQGGETDIGYQDLPQVASFLILIFLAVVAPELVSRDLRNHLLPLYFSRPVGRVDYVLAKLGALVVAAWLILAGPQLLIFVASAFGGADFLGELKDLLGGFAMAAMYAVLFGTVSLLIASLASRRAFAAGAIAAVYLISLPVVAVVMALGSETARQIAPMASPFMLPEGIREWIWGNGGDIDVGSYGPAYGVVGLLLPAICVLLLLLRYRRVSL